MSNGEILNEAEVDFLLKGAEEDIPEAPAPSLDDGEHTVTMRGDLDKINLSDIFQTLAMSSMEGVLRVRNALEERQVYCSDHHVRILVPNRVTLRRLGSRLVQAGMISGEQLRDALNEQKDARIPLGELLVRDGIVSAKQLNEIVGMQVAEDLFSLFTWRHGTFEFFKAETTGDYFRERFEGCPEYEINSLLLEVARRSDEWDTILEQLTSLDEIPHQAAQPADPDDLNESHNTVLRVLDGHSTYRQLCDQTTISLFDFCRAARDLSAGGILAHLDDAEFAGVASTLAEEGEHKRAIVLLQTLRDRPGDRPLPVIQEMAAVLEQAEEKRLASQLLLEAAQRSPDPEQALQLARDARTLVPYEPGTLSFLRTVLIAHASPDSPELEKVTLDLLDAMIDNDLAPTAIEIIDDARRTDTMSPQILMREARARQKAKDIDGAIKTLEELVEHFENTHARSKVIESLEAIFRLDRTRKDVHKRITQLKRTQTDRIVRVAVFGTVLALVGGSGFIWWQQRAFEASVVSATSEVQELIESRDLTTARTRFQSWSASLGECQAIEDLRSRIAFAEAAEKKRLKDLARADVLDKLRAAARAGDVGDVATMVQAYIELHERADMRDEVINNAGMRTDRLLDGLEVAAGKLATEMPPAPDDLLDRDQLTTNRANLLGHYSVELQLAFEGLSALSAQEQLPSFLGEERLARIATLLAEFGPRLNMATERTHAYDQALKRNDTQRRLDPTFQAAVEKEKAFDFDGALELYRMLEQATTEDAELRTHFRDRVTRNATISRLLKEVAEATAKGDYRIAMQHIKALRVSFPDVEFDQIARLPLAITSQPAGARVLVNNKEIGTTPLLLSRRPIDKLAVSLASDRFLPIQFDVAGDYHPSLMARLMLTPAATWKHNKAIESRPAAVPDGSGDWLIVDRSGHVRRRSADLARDVWDFDSEDLSGWLTPPLVRGQTVLIASLDGTLRALSTVDGSLAWQLDDMPCEVTPVLFDSAMAIATTDGQLHAIDLAERRRHSARLAEPAHGALLRHRDSVLVVGERGKLACLAMPSLTPVWTRQLADLASPTAALAGDVLVAGDDHGVLYGIAALDGTLVWQRKLETTLLGRFCVVNNVIIAPTEQERLRVDARTGSLLEPLRKLEAPWAGVPTGIGSRLLMPLEGGGLQVVDAKTGRPEYRLPGNARCKVLVVAANDGSVFVASESHTIRRYTDLP
ncbi:MAG: DUF4388 domain-containing protein [Planctomycetota bacterium]